VKDNRGDARSNGSGKGEKSIAERTPGQVLQLDWLAEFWYLPLGQLVHPAAAARATEEGKICMLKKRK
jgi:nitric oxide reductase activation protein